jgi:hypothetical protein
LPGADGMTVSSDLSGSDDTDTTSGHFSRVRGEREGNGV